MKEVPDMNEILESHARIRPYIHNTPVLTSTFLDNLADGKIFLKCENFQKAGAFKSRGACNTVFLMTDEEACRGVATHSSGNHAAALARAASLRGIPCHVVMPSNSAAVKIEATRFYGGLVTFCEPVLAARESTLEEVISQTGAIEVHSYNDPRIIAGQATAALELVTNFPDLDIVMAPVGGGGLLSGTALSVKYFSPDTRVFGAEPAQADDAFRSFQSRTFIRSEKPDTIADGLRTSLGSITFRIIVDEVDGILTVTEESIIQAMLIIWERMKIIIEPSSAVPVAALLTYPELFRKKRTGIIISGGNVDLRDLPWK